MYYIFIVYVYSIIYFFVMRMKILIFVAELDFEKYISIARFVSAESW